MALIIKAYRLLEQMVCGPSAQEIELIALTVSLPTLNDIDYELLGSTKSWQADEV